MKNYLKKKLVEASIKLMTLEGQAAIALARKVLPHNERAALPLITFGVAMTNPLYQAYMRDHAARSVWIPITPTQLRQAVGATCAGILEAGHLGQMSDEYTLNRMGYDYIPPVDMDKLGSLLAGKASHAKPLRVPFKKYEAASRALLELMANKDDTRFVCGDNGLEDMEDTISKLVNQMYGV
tara:strand:- start:6475 stop:7020 length:546 start_codon:yes stop_codon:yes gene_type:complete